MSKESSSKKTTNGVETEDKKEQAKVNVVAQYIRDLSFECPNNEALLTGLRESPNLNVEINVNANNIRENYFESIIEFTAKASNKTGIIYDLELSYSGIFKLENIPESALEQLLLVNCPSLLFPFMRRVIADLTRENGFPPLFLEPIDFAGLYLNRQNKK